MADVPDIPGMRELWGLTLGDPRVRVALLDGFAELSHPCLRGANIRELPVFWIPEGERDDGPAEHATHVASVLFSPHDSEVPGIAPRCQGLSIPVAHTERHADDPLALVRALDMGRDAGAQIIHVAVAHCTDTGIGDSLVEQAVRRCLDAGILIVAPTGNEGGKMFRSPASQPGVLAVGAMGDDGAPIDFSNFGGVVQEQGVLAPGENMFGARPGGGTWRRKGTSCAAPIVTGVASLLMSLQVQRGEKPSAASVRRAILDTAVPCGPTDTAELARCMRGRLNIPGAVAAIAGESANLALKALQLDVYKDLQRRVGTVEREAELARVMAILKERLGGRFQVTGRVKGLHSVWEKMQRGWAFDEIQDLTSVRIVASTIADCYEALGAVHALWIPIPGRFKDYIATPKSNSYQSLHTHVIGPRGGAIEIQIRTPEMHRVAEEGPAAHALYKERGDEETVVASAAAVAFPGSLVYALGTIGYDFGTEARRDTFRQLMPPGPAGQPGNPWDARQLVRHLEENPAESSSLIWTLRREQTPMFALEPSGAFAHEVYERLCMLLDGASEDRDSEDYIEQVSVPGRLSARRVRLMSGQVLPVVEIEHLRGLFGWKVNRLVDLALAGLALQEDGRARRALRDLLDRIYHELANPGLLGRHRALNFAATNAVQMAGTVTEAIHDGLSLDTIEVVKSPVCRQYSLCWDVKLKFFDPENLRRARHVYRFTVDVSDVMPVTLGEVRSWREVG